MGVLGWIASALLLFWIVGFFLKLGAAILNIVLIVAIVMFIINFIFGRRKTTSR